MTVAKKKVKLDAEELALEKDMTENPDDWLKATEPGDIDGLLRAAREWAARSQGAQTAKKPEKAISMRVDEALILMGQHRAAQEGYSGYQALMKSVFHRYLTGRLVDPELAVARAAARKKRA
jgi:predicted DNA binding CopG/RHH family protein